MTTMDRDEYTAFLLQLQALATVARGMDLEGFLACARDAEEMGPYIDPTAWMAGRERLTQIRSLAEAARQFQQRIREVPADGKHSR